MGKLSSLNDVFHDILHLQLLGEYAFHILQIQQLPQHAPNQARL